MPRSLQEILDTADALADQFEQLDPESLEWKDATPLPRIRAAVVARAGAERELADAVAEARTAGISWSAIAGYLGTSGEAARQRYGTALTKK